LAPIRLFLICSSLKAGGAERVLVTLANAWAAYGHEVTLVTTFSMGGEDFYSLHARVVRVRLTDITGISSRSLRSQWARFLALRRLLAEQRPDVAIAFMEHTAVVTLMAAFGLDLRVIACERTDPTQHSIGRLWRWLRQWSYPRAAAVTVQTDAVKESFGRMITGISLKVVPNPVPVELMARPARPGGDTQGRRRIVAMGRLGPEKGFDMLIEAFASVASQNAEWDLWIWGEGTERGPLEARVASSGLTGRVFMPGQTRSPWNELEKAEFVVLSSRFEGLPNVMLEAMALGRAVVAFDCPSGPRELSREGRDAVLVPKNDVGALAGAMGRLMVDEGERRRIGQAALSVCERYSLESVLTIWDDVLSVALARSGER
jgi:GalNAc-alpha-(1->4)-GalNAc-alpha-(1->3)-diNAcBac-PP-undecaprenol alpha-1,4-N-acetyl-D-galactosaminyltransferase